MKYLMMLVISLGLVGCGSSDSDSDSGSKGSDAVEKWVEFKNSRVGDYSRNVMSYNVNDGSRTLFYRKQIIEQQPEEVLEGIRENATDITGNSYCSIYDVSNHRCIYIDNADSLLKKIESLDDESISEESVEINSVNSRSTFLLALSTNYRTITAMNLETSTTYEDGDESENNNIVGEWTFKTYTFNDNKLIGLRTTTSKATCTATECTEINLTGLTYQEITDEVITANIWLGSQGDKTAEVVMSPDQKELSIMICKDFAKIKSITECSFIAGTRVEEEAKE